MLTTASDMVEFLDHLERSQELRGILVIARSPLAFQITMTCSIFRVFNSNSIQNERTRTRMQLRKSTLTL